MTMTKQSPTDPGALSRAQGCLLGQLAGDALGGLVEFKSPEQILQAYPDGVRQLADGGTWNTIAGQPTDDSEMALALARTLVALRSYDEGVVTLAYTTWLESEPFDCGLTVSTGLQGDYDLQSQANGALMRISPLGIFGANHAPEQVAEWARQDAAITHRHPVCAQANALFAMAIAHAIQSGCDAPALYRQIKTWAARMKVDAPLLKTIKDAASSPPDDYMHLKGWVLIAFHNALWQLNHAPNVEEGVVDTVMRGGDTDTNAAICGALLGAVRGRDAVPTQWTECLQNCRPSGERTDVYHPRPEYYWPVDALELAAQLLAGG